MSRAKSFARLAMQPLRVGLGRAVRGPRVRGWSAREELAWAIIRGGTDAMCEHDAEWARAFQRTAPGPPLGREVERVDYSLPGDGVALQHTQARAGPAIFYIHGGGYVIGDPNTYLGLVARLLREGGQAVLPRYPLAPERRPVDALDHLEAAYRAFVEREAVDPGRVVIAGDSAGAALAQSLCRRLVLGEGPAPAAVYLLSPWTEPFEDRFVDGDGGDQDILSQAFLEWTIPHWRGRESEDDPELVLGLGLVEGLPPTLVQDGDFEVFHPQIERFVAQSRAKGNEVEYQSAPRMFHVFQMATGVMPRADEALDAARAWLRAQIR